MTETSDIPSAHPSIEGMSRNNTPLMLAALVVVSIFFASFLSVVAAEENKKEQHISSLNNAQTLKLLRPTTFKSSLAFGGSVFNTIDNALIGSRSTLDDFGDGFVERTGHSTNIYIVRQGDTISEIAESFGITQETIRWANNIGSRKSIRVGQQLVILPVSGVIHTIKKGDTLAKIAKQYTGETDAILAYNKLSEEALEVGQEITIPGGKIKAPKTVAKRAATVRSTGSKGVVSVTSKARSSYRAGINVNYYPTTRITSPSYPSYFIRPISGYSLSRGIHGHNAVDIAAPRGTPILASAGGTVETARSSGWNYGYGKYIIIRHPNGTKTLYAHTSRIAIRQGQNVVKGQVIGYVGSTGNSTGNHLHFEVRNAKNPISF